MHGEERGRLGPRRLLRRRRHDRPGRSAPRRSTAETELKCYGLTFWDFRPLVESDARIAWPLLQVMAKRLRAAEAELLAPPRSSRARAGSPLSAAASTPSSTTAAEEHAAHAELGADAHRLARRLALEGRPVDRALAGDDEVVARAACSRKPTASST